MREPTYGEALRASWRLAWQHKDLWVFGLFAMLLGQFGLMDLVAKVWLAIKSGGVSSFADTLALMISPRTWQLVARSFDLPAEGWVWLIWLTVMLLGLAVAIGFVAVVSQGALVYAAAKFSKRTSIFPSDRKAWHHSVTHFWRLLGLNILRKLSFALVTLAIVSLTLSLAGSPTSADTAIFVIGFLLTLLIGVVLSFLLIYAVGYVVVEEYRLGEAIAAAWRLFTSHWLVSLEVGVVVLLANIVFLLVALVGVVYVFFLPILLAKWMAIQAGSAAILQTGIVLGYGLFLLFMMLLGAIFTVFTTSVWTYLFTKMHSKGVVSRMVRWLSR